MAGVIPQLFPVSSGLLTRRSGTIPSSRGSPTTVHPTSQPRLQPGVCAIFGRHQPATRQRLALSRRRAASADRPAIEKLEHRLTLSASTVSDDLPPLAVGSPSSEAVIFTAAGQAPAAASPVRASAATPVFVRSSLVAGHTAKGGAAMRAANVRGVITNSEDRFLDLLFRDNCAGIARNAIERAYAKKAFEASLWGGSFAWFYSRQQRQAYAAAGPRGVSAPLNAFYSEPKVSPESTGLITPNVNVLYAETWMQVKPGQPVVVRFPGSNAAPNRHFISLQVANSASETLATFSTFPGAPDGASIPIEGGDILFYSQGDDGEYPGTFVHRVEVNTEVVFAAGRTLTGVGLPGDNPFSETQAAEVAAKFVAAEYSAYTNNGLSMAGLTNNTSTTSDAATLARLVNVSRDLKGLHFWRMFGEALVQSPLPTSGPGSQLDWKGRTPTEYLETFGSLGLSASGWSPANLSRRQLEILERVANRAHKMFINMLKTIDEFPSSKWSSVPSNLGAYPNSPSGYLERDAAHLANRPNFAVYPTLSRDSAGNLFKGRNTYVMVLPASSLPSTPPLSPGATANSDGFWSFNVYDTNFNVTPSMSGYLRAVNRLRPVAARPEIGNPNNSGHAPNISFSSLRTPGSVGSTEASRYRVEPNGDVVLILSPTRPKDSRYWNNWIPTPLVTYVNPQRPNAAGRFVRNDQFSAMLRVYTPSIYNFAAEARLRSAEVSDVPRQWVIPEIHKATGLAAKATIQPSDVLAAIERRSR